MNILFNTVNETPYIQNCESKDVTDINALSYLVKELTLSQSDKIKLGTGVERTLEQFIITNGKDIGWINIKQKNIKGVKETDHLFVNKKIKLIVYAESKANLNLDTEKAPKTSDKINGITDNLIKETETIGHEYYGYKVSSNLLGLRYINSEQIPKVLKTKYRNNSSFGAVNLSSKSEIVGINEYLKIFGFNIIFDDIGYKKYITHICVKMFKI